MSLSVRLLSGLILASLGFWITNNLLPKTGLLQFSFISSFMIPLFWGALGIFLVPILGGLFRRWVGLFVQRVASEVAAQLRERFPTPKSKVVKIKVPVSEGMKALLDTSAIIDGRIADIVKTGFLCGTILVPRFVLSELQHIADSDDDLRRGRGRRGFQILDELKKDKRITLKIIDQEVTADNVDEKLLKLSKILHSDIITTDYNLNKVAQISGIKILNVNELANSVKTVALPGEEMVVKVIQDGKEKGQGVGYLADGTMIVVENGRQFVGQTITVVVSRILQTVAGRMIFTQLKK